MANECIFCKIVAGQIPAAKITEDSTTLCFLDINPRNPGHTLVIPKKHYETILDMSPEECGKIFEKVRLMTASVKIGTKADGISVLQSNYKAAGQVVPHVHFHVIPRFESEGPPSLESTLSVKRMPEEVLKKIAETIRGSSGREQPKETPQPEVRKKVKDDGDVEFDF